ncbi:HAD-IA family hydrolase [Saccharomonospora sp. NPDC006951]
MTPEELLRRSRALLLDFDGPICSVFAGIPAHVVADQLRAVLSDYGHTDLPPEVATAEDPFDVFRYAATLGDAEARCVEAAFTAHEVEAIRTAEPTRGAIELMTAWHNSGRPLAIVSNNSVAAIETYLQLYDLSSIVNFVSARTGHDWTQLKPQPDLLFEAAERLHVSPENCAFIGDSTSDAEAAQSALVPFIGYANRPHKRVNFMAANAATTTDQMSDLRVCEQP